MADTLELAAASVEWLALVARRQREEPHQLVERKVERFYQLFGPGQALETAGQRHLRQPPPL